MSDALNTYGDYARLIFFLLADRATIESHTVAVYTTSQTIGITRGHVVFRSGHVLRVFEQVDFVAHRIVRYFYELTREYLTERLVDCGQASRGRRVARR